MSSYTLKVFNTGQITLPKVWRDKWNTKHFIAKETSEGLLIKPLDIKEKEVVSYEDDNGFGLYCESGLPTEEIINKIKDIHGSN